MDNHTTNGLSRRELITRAGLLGMGALAASGLEADGAETKSDIGSAATDFVEEQPRKTPVAHHCDICVIGGSCTGLFAAVAAARLGAKVVIVENHGFFGGVATASLVNVWHSLYNTHLDKQIIRGRTEEGKNAALAALSARIGIRETRHAKCLHILKENEVLEGTRFPDAIANGSYRVDIHNFDRPGITFRYLDGREHYVEPGVSSKWSRWRPEREKDPTFYQIPYRSLVPVGSTNVLVAGRVLGADRGAFGAVRVMVNCSQTGEAAGTAAYLALDADGPVTEVDTDKLRGVMKKQGSIIL